MVWFLGVRVQGEEGSECSMASPTETRVPEEAKVSRRKEVRRSSAGGGEGLKPLKTVLLSGPTTAASDWGNGRW